MATIVGGLGSLRGAVLGGFLIGALTVTLQATLPLELRPYRDAFVFAAVLAILVVRPQGLLPARATLAREEPNPGRLRRPRRVPRPRPPLPRGVTRPAGAVLTETVWPPAALAALTFLVAVVAWLLGPDSLDRVVVGMVINTILVVGLYTFVGVSGVFSFGHAAFMAIGAYAGAILVIPEETKPFVLPDLPGFLVDAHLSPLPATIVAGAIAAAVALVVAVPLARLSGLTAGLATFALLSIVNVVSRNWEQLTHGTAGVSGIPTTTTLWVALAWAAVAIGAAWAFQRSRVGLRLRASREDEAGARSIGIGVAAERTIAFVLSAFLAGVAGALLGMFIGSFNPDAFFLNITFLMVAMLIIGGMTSLTGAVVGTLAISSLSELLRRLEGGADLGLVELSAQAGPARRRARARHARGADPAAERAHRRPRARLAAAPRTRNRRTGCGRVGDDSCAVCRSAARCVLACSLAGCGGGGDSSNGADEGPITIGTANSLTGALAPFETAINDGMKVAVADINAAGGVDGRQLELIHVDAKSDLNLAATAALEVIEKGADVVVPICDADFGAPGARAANEKGVLAITCAGAPGHRPPDGRPARRSTPTPAPRPRARSAPSTRTGRRAGAAPTSSATGPSSTRRSSARRSRRAGRSSAARSPARTRSSRATRRSRRR